MQQHNIKFRAWDRENNEMADWDKVKPMSILWLGRQQEQFYFMQFTGLLDKNGKEIYEGDILRWNAKDGTEVVKNVFWILAETRFALGEYMLTDAGANNCEIIGNIYENPELLK